MARVYRKSILYLILIVILLNASVAKGDLLRWCVEALSAIGNRRSAPEKANPTAADYRDLSPQQAENYANSINSEIERAVALANQGKLNEAVRHLHSLNTTTLEGSGFSIGNNSEVTSLNVDKPDLIHVLDRLSRATLSKHQGDERGPLSIKLVSVALGRPGESRWESIADGGREERLPHVIGARKYELAVAIEELTHVLQRLNQQAGRPPFVSRLMRDPRNVQRVLAANQSGHPLRVDSDATEADAYARLLELFGPEDVAALEPNYSTRPVVRSLMFPGRE